MYRLPPLPQLKLSKRAIWPGCDEIEVEGELDLAVADRLRLLLDRSAHDSRHVLVDLKGCDFVDVAVLEVLVEADERLAARGCQLLLFGARGQPRRLLEVTDLAGGGHPFGARHELAKSVSKELFAA